ncbi:Folylpolyglutamate synthase [Neolecta irregularis DAH-3]|uniref:Folylpolyglutamate synthase n=1 Tax=Neolecta irregularis (strain DAH-3) TaxID=1198029 RepID=A0A1U7LK05_NEOID|nr:Folylpolyglutamate synthase [Neolecta irregularis DAH-3]|eukprot:OLL22882.1 Folylpolyglutamate synthase [Neolecta irregularis DAH-3]
MHCLRPILFSRFFHTMKILESPRSYKNAIDALNSLQSNADAVEQMIKDGAALNATSMQEMRGWLMRLGYEPSKLDKLNVIHVSGTKGKGSTCAFISSILNKYRISRGFPSKIGLFTSPHLKVVRERIQINNEPIGEEEFSFYFFQVWDRIKQFESDSLLPKPRYFRFLTLLAWHVFAELKVDTVILEVGIGGEYDCTNAIEKPTCIGITNLGLDHTAILGNSIKEIAWHKTGIMKSGRPALTVPQPADAMQVIHARAQEKHVPLIIIEPTLAQDMKLGLSGHVQPQNASLAIALVKEHFKTLGFLNDHLPFHKQAEVIAGVASASCPGRCEIIRRGAETWYLDGAHTHESIEVAASWFCTASSGSQSKTRILLFNQPVRNASTLLEILHRHCDSEVQFDHVIFCTNITWKATGYEDGFLFLLQHCDCLDLSSMNVDQTKVESLQVQHKLACTWAKISGKGFVHIKSTIEEAVLEINQITGFKDIFVCGSMHLIGGLMVVLEKFCKI